ncbi:MAG TPA: AgmX/PglI C-terminal domain-containing protein [Polyangiaceae bacterium]
MQTFEFRAAAQAAPMPFSVLDPVAARLEPAETATSYALIKHGPAVPSEEVESLHAVAAEIMVLWGTNVLHVVHLSPPRPFAVGERGTADLGCDYHVPREVLGVEQLPLLLGEASAPRLVIPGGASGTLQIPGRPLIDLGALGSEAQPSPTLPGAREVRLESGYRARVQLNGFVFQVAIVNAGRKVKKGLLAFQDWTAASYFGGSFMAVGALMAAMAFFVPPMNLLPEEDLERERLYLINAILDGQAEKEREQKNDVAKAEDASSEGGTGQRAAAEEGAMGKQTSRASNKRYAVEGPSDNADPHLARAQALNEATSFGIIAMLTGDPNAPTAHWGRDTSLGTDPRSAQGNMWGDDIGEAFGAGGLGLSGIGEGGGGNSLGSLGLGNICMGGGNCLGHGAGLGLKDGFGNGVGSTRGGRKPNDPPRMREGVSQVSGRLPPEVIQRIVRQNFGRFRMCYEQGLASNPNLEGRVAVRFAISGDGSVAHVQNGGSDLPDSKVVGCVVSAFYGVSFPKPENGIVTVTYPIMFSPG